jgi:hypothetical protein
LFKIENRSIEGKNRDRQVLFAKPTIKIWQLVASKYIMSVARFSIKILSPSTLCSIDELCIRGKNKTFAFGKTA